MSTESRTKTITNPKSCFLNLSYTSGSSTSRIERIISDYFKGSGFEVKTGRMASAGENTDKGILQVIKSCSFGIVVYNEFRHNISYEWGIMDALGMPVIPVKDKNTHIDIDNDFSDKKGINFVYYFGDSDEKYIIKDLENSDSLKAAIERVEKRIRDSISPEDTDEVKAASRILTESNISLSEISEDKKEIKIPGIVNMLSVLSNVEKLTPEGRFYYAGVYYYAGDLKNAEKELRAAIRIKPDYAEAHNDLGVLFKKMGSTEDAEAEYRDAIRINPDYAIAHYNLGNLLKEMGSTEDAEKEYRDAIRINPDYAIAHYNLGNLLKEMGCTGDAEAEYRAALRIKPNYAEVHNNLGNLLRDKGREEEAEAEFRDALRINPDYAEVHNNLGILLRDKGREEEAEAEFRAALRINPDYVAAHNNLGNLLGYRGRKAAAEAEYRDALQINPESAVAHNNLGNFLQETGRKEDAKKEYRAALRINSNYAEAHANLGILFLETGNKETAKNELEIAKELFEKEGREADVKKAEELLKSL